MFNKSRITGWVILALGMVFIWMSIDPLINDTEKFLRITGMVLGVGLISAFVILLILNKTLPDDRKDEYQEWLDDQFNEKRKEKENEN
mgnify:FL=1